MLAIEKETNPAPWTEKSFRHEIDYKYGRFVVGTASGQVVAYAGIWLVIDEAHITTVSVSPQWRRQGIGRTLTAELLQHAKAEGMICATLEVRAGNEAAIALYEGLGFVVTARRKAYYPNNQEDAIVMWLHGLKSWEPV